MRGTPKSRPTILREGNNIASDENSVKLTMMKSNTDLSVLEEEKKIMETPTLPLQISAVKPRRNAPTGKPPPGRNTENLLPSLSAPDLTQTKSKKKSPMMNSVSTRKLSPRLETSQKLSPRMETSRKLSPRMEVSSSVNEDDLNAEHVNSGTNAGSVKRKRGGKEASATPMNKRKKNPKVQLQDCSKEVMCLRQFNKCIMI